MLLQFYITLDLWIHILLLIAYKFKFIFFRTKKTLTHILQKLRLKKPFSEKNRVAS